jgi:hypothetical protein
MNLLLWGITLGTIGKLVLGIAVLRVHVHILREHKIDAIVLKSLKREQYVTALGLALIVFGFMLEILFYNQSTNLLECLGAECAASIHDTLSR